MDIDADVNKKMDTKRFVADDIPDLAMPVVEALRKDVPKPDYKLFYAGRIKKIHKQIGDMGELECCPMGLHKNSETALPSCASQFNVKGVSDESVRWFSVWWDTITWPNAPERTRIAVNTVWPN